MSSESEPMQSEPTESEPMEMTSGDYSHISQTYPLPEPAEPVAAPILSLEPPSSSESSTMPSAEVRRAKRGKAHMDSDGPMRKRGCPRKRRVDAAEASTSRPPPQMVTYGQFHTAMWKHYTRHMTQSNEVRRLGEDLVKTRAELAGMARDLAEARRHIGRHERFFANLRDLFVYRVDDTLKAVVSFLIGRFEFKPPTPPPPPAP